MLVSFNRVRHGGLVARVRYEDSDGRTGEVEQSDVRPGDIVRFTADFTKIADPEHEDLVITVSAGELAEVIHVDPRIEVEALATWIGHTKPRRVSVPARDVLLLLDARDPRSHAARRKSAALHHWLPLIIWVFEETQDPRDVRITQRRHVLEALDQFQAPTPAIGVQIDEARAALDAMSQADWDELWPLLEQRLREDPQDAVFHGALQRWVDAETLETPGQPQAEEPRDGASPPRSQLRRTPEAAPYGAPLDSADAHTDPHAWGRATTRVPLAVPPGFFPGQTSALVWAEPGLYVEHRATGVSGEIVRALPGQKVEVQIHAPRTRRIIWPASAIRVAPQEERALVRVTPRDLQKLRTDRYSS